MQYRIRVYSSRALGESGKYLPNDTFTTGSFESARKFARDAADDYGAAVIENTETGERYWFE